ncbi:adenylate/guanylate cyclase domain-containing protein [Ruegeria profundi]|uniref:adenylate/guanylate cyclase domain-containing protein n=1 Tax=Ruegeria profundi TaxID=1685378 RepID=UPI001CD66F49|nr:adenylate/guanylate cyclase domain-containing protein [Ruegeria profundi]MCA0928799.1 adenylate/guanylate cyclase domain-containing protein [Ruegeria profundi]
MKIRLQIGVATVFTLLTLIVTAILVAFLYFGNKQLALRTAQDRMGMARAQSVEDMLAVIRGAGDVVSSASVFLLEFPEQATSLAGLDVLYSQMQGNDHYYGLYFAEEKSGDFFQNINLPKGWETFGPDTSPVPAGVDRVKRIISEQEQKRVETYYWAQTGEPAEPFFSGSTEYDPRTRPWYLGAKEQTGIYITPLYRFESTGRLGVTVAKRVLNLNGELVGVVALDMTISALSQILDDIRIGDHGRAFMLNHEGHLLSYTGTRFEGEAAHFVSTDPNERIEIDNEVIDSAITEWRASQKAFFHFVPPSGKYKHIASVAPIPQIFDVQPILGLTVPEDEFVGAIKATTIRALQVGGFALVLAVAFTFVVARLLSNNLTRVATEARRMSNFDLSDDLEVKSTIKEVADLQAAITSMKAGLSSFGAYVPKELVRSIVSKAQRITVGGDTRDVTLMFSDLQAFTSQTEGLEPEVLMPALSEYFEAMEKEISCNSGTVDKYIGDAIMALWNAPLDDPEHAINACKAALACLEAEARLNSEKDASPLRPLYTRFGLHTGRVVVGNVGSRSRLQYTALGSAVNFASRLEGLNKVYGTRILVSEALFLLVSDSFYLREIDVVAPAGTTSPTRIYELMGGKSDVGESRIKENVFREHESWQACYALYRSRNWSESLNAFQAHRSIARNKLLIDTFITRCNRFIADPPSADWDGVYRFARK